MTHFVPIDNIFHCGITIYRVIQLWTAIYFLIHFVTKYQYSPSLACCKQVVPSFVTSHP